MTRWMESIHKFEKRFDTKAKELARKHPCIAFATVLIGMPLFILTAVCASTTIIVVPVAGLLGWL